MAPSSIPLFGARVALLILSIGFGAVGVASVFNAEKKSDETKSDAADAVHATGLPATLDIDISDVKRAGTAAGVGDLGLLVLALATLLLVLFDSRKNTTSRDRLISTRTLPLQLGLFVLATVFTLITTVVTTVYVATHGATIHASLNGKALPQATIDALAKQLGFHTDYKDAGYLIFLAVAPWFAFLAAFLTSIVTWLAWNRSKSTQTASISEDEKHTTGHISPA